MLVKRCLVIPAFFFAKSVSAVEPFSLRIYTPVDSDFFIKTLNEGWTIDSYDKAQFSGLEDAEKGIPNHKKAMYSVSGQIDWTEELSDQTPVRKRAFWVEKGDPDVYPARELLEVSG